jgi:hypothetical protein
MVPAFSGLRVYLQCLFTVHVGRGSSPTSSVEFSHSWFLGSAAAPAFSSWLVRESPPCLLGPQGAPPSLLHVFFVIAYCSVSFFPGWGSVCPGGYADLAQGCLWEYRIPLSSPCGPRLPKPSGRWHLAAVWELFWFLHLT